MASEFLAPFQSQELKMVEHVSSTSLAKEKQNRPIEVY